MRVLFLGTPEFALPTLEFLLDSSHSIVGVMTRPDRPLGRSGAAVPSPVKRSALERGLPTLQPARVNSEGTYRRVRERHPDVAVVVAFGRLLSPDFLAIPRHGCINLHASLLPAYRGAAPIQWAVARGERATGLTTMLMDAGLDTGDVLLQRTVSIHPEETAAELAGRLSSMGGPLVLETLAGLEAGTLTPRPQPADAVSFAPVLRKEDGRIDWRWDAARIANLVRGMQPWPVAHTALAEGSLRLFRASPAGHGEQAAPPGTVIGLRDDAVLVACGEGGLLAVREVQPESHRRMSGQEAVNGRILRVGGRLGP